MLYSKRTSRMDFYISEKNKSVIEDTIHREIIKKGFSYFQKGVAHEFGHVIGNTSKVRSIRMQMSI